MKYVNSYKIFENKDINYVQQDIKDICLELQDIGFHVSVQKNQKNTQIYVFIYDIDPYSDVTRFNVTDDISQVLFRIHNYITEIDYSYKLYANFYKMGNFHKLYIDIDNETIKYDYKDIVLYKADDKHRSISTNLVHDITMVIDIFRW